MTLFEIYNEYRCGNKDIFNTIATDRVILGECKSYGQSNFELISPLKELSRKLYEKYSVPYRQPKGKSPKYYDAAYYGTSQDMAKDIVMILFELFNDGDFTAQNETELFRELKKRAVKYINDSIKISPCTVPDERMNKDGETESLIDALEDEAADVEEIVEEHESIREKKHLYFISEMNKVMQSCDITELCQSDAAVQKNIIKLMKKYYHSFYDGKSDIVRYPNETEMLMLYCNEYGEISQPQYSRALEAVFKTLCNCTTSLKGYPQSRARFRKSPYTPQIRCIEISETDLEEMLSGYIRLGFETDKSIEDIMKISAGNASELWWNLSPDKNGYSIKKYRKNADGTGYRRYGNNNNKVVMNGKIICITVGKCRLFIADRKIYSYAADKEIFYIKRKQNEYAGYSISA